MSPRSGRARILLVVVAATAAHATGCLPTHRLNASCSWTSDTVDVATLDPGARRAHLVEDVRVAQDLGIRHGDSVAGRIWTDANRVARETCTQASLREVARRHGTTVAELQPLALAREWWLDVLLVFLPSALLLAAAASFVMGRVAAGYDAGDRTIMLAVVLVLVPILAAAGLVIAQIWGVSVESWRLQTDHISYRSAQIPFYRHRVISYAAAVLVVAGAAAVSIRRWSRARADARGRSGVSTREGYR